MSEDKFKIDGDKILHHKERVKQWLFADNNWDEAKKIYPVYVEISPAGACNHRCSFCAVDYIGYKKRFPDTNILMERLAEMGQLGVKSIMYAGEGEPTLNKDLGRLIVHTKKSGIDVAITTNASLLKEELVRESLSSTTWIKASINAGTKESYSKIHKAPEKDFDKAWGNMSKAVKIREELCLNPQEHTLGAQMVLIEENKDESLIFAKRAKDEGLDYAVIKPYSQHKMSITREYEGIRYEDALKKEAELEALNSDSFKVYFRKRTMEELSRPVQLYNKCQSTPNFWAYLMADGDLYGCSAFLEDDRFCYGNIMESTFREIWEGEKRKANMGFVQDGLDISSCRRNCRMHKVNETLYQLKLNSKPLEVLDSLSLKEQPHINFI